MGLAELTPKPGADHFLWSVSSLITLCKQVFNVMRKNFKRVSEIEAEWEEMISNYIK